MPADRIDDSVLTRPVYGEAQSDVDRAKAARQRMRAAVKALPPKPVKKDPRTP